ncbi:MAG: gas vesicle protein G [Haloquadratum sp. J07HQX50]|jgi:Gas vesicle protein G.|nr:MAG: gas vesicle protein G [Haloquadratum sp. J07HQX50]
MLLIDDLLIRPFISLVEIIQNMALDEMYDTEKIRDELKENQLLFELGERSESEYRQTKEKLETQLKLADEVRSQMSSKVEIKQ